MWKGRGRDGRCSPIGLGHDLRDGGNFPQRPLAKGTKGEETAPRAATGVLDGAVLVNGKPQPVRVRERPPFSYKNCGAWFRATPGAAREGGRVSQPSPPFLTRLPCLDRHHEGHSKRGWGGARNLSPSFRSLPTWSHEASRRIIGQPFAVSTSRTGPLGRGQLRRVGGRLGGGLRTPRVWKMRDCLLTECN
jgi:hypothetical protein